METLLLTGASGFLGCNILPLLRDNYDVTTLGRSQANDIAIDLAESEPTLPRQFDIVVHAAGLAHVRPKTPQDEQVFFDVNVRGTQRLCHALESSGLPRAFIYISSVAVYGCDSGEMINEDYPRQGKTPYARSKIMAEDFLSTWCSRRGVCLTILRPSLLVGDNPPGNLGDMIRSIRRGFYVNIAGGKARKSLLMASDIAHVIHLVKYRGGTYNLSDNDNPSYREISALIAGHLGKSQARSIPYIAARFLAIVGDCLGPKSHYPLNSSRLYKLTRTLTFSNAKATTLPWQPTPVLSTWLKQN